MSVAIIPARGGSKRIPRKNIKIFSGKPMIAWSIEAAIESKCFQRIIVSTDDEEIAHVARQYGAETPFARPAELSGDYTGTIEVIQHALHWLQDNKSLPELACCIYATAPFLQYTDLQSGQNALSNSDASYAFSVTTYSFPIQRALKISPEMRINAYDPLHIFTRSQDLEETYHDAGQFYWGRSTAFLNNDVIFSEKSLPIILPRHRVQDIDTNEDWIRAELMFQAYHGKSVNK